jgi:hypothetical protein
MSDTRLTSKPSFSRAAKQGYLTLMTVLIVSAIGVAISVSLLTLGVGSSERTLTIQDLERARALASTCAEQALQELRRQTSFAGSTTTVLFGGNCSYTVVAGASESRTISAQGSAGNAIARLRVIGSVINPRITITYWQETSN